MISPMDFDLFITNKQRDITFTCTASGSPAPTISFMYEGMSLTRTDGKPMSLGGALMERVMVGSEMASLNSSTGLYTVSQSLTLFDAVDEDSGNFICSANADIPGTGTRIDSVIFNLTVYGKLYLMEKDAFGN